MAEQLTEREKTVLRYIVHNFILSATPVGSRYISRKHGMGLSPATIRNVMANLEEMGYLSHPHTSAGRIPTDVGYRFYVNSLMEIHQLTETEKQTIRRQLDSVSDAEEMLRESSKLLGKISRQLSVVSSPHLSSGTFEKLELVTISSNKIIVILAIKSGLVRTIMMEVYSEIPREKMEDISSFLNQRLSGLTLQQIRDTFSSRVQDFKNEESGLIRLFIESVDKLFADIKEGDKVHIAGTENLITQPEFGNPENFRGIIELINNEDIIVHVLEKHDGTDEVTVTIGQENEEKRMRIYSVVTSPYSIGDVTGTVGLIGPKRMDYSKLIPLVDYVAKVISKMMS
ncbi:MAG: heat-inducible transcriptional repressor HrcA [Bacteroidota bacterium]